MEVDVFFFLLEVIKCMVLKWLVKQHSRLLVLRVEANLAWSDVLIILQEGNNEWEVSNQYSWGEFLSFNDWLWLGDWLNWFANNEAWFQDQIITRLSFKDNRSLILLVVDELSEVNDSVHYDRSWALRDILVSDKCLLVYGLAIHSLHV